MELLFCSVNIKSQFVSNLKGLPFIVLKVVGPDYLKDCLFPYEFAHSFCSSSVFCPTPSPIRSLFREVTHHKTANNIKNINTGQSILTIH